MITYSVSYFIHIYMIPEDVLPGDSKAIGIIGVLLNHSYPELYSPRRRRRGGDEEKHEHFCSLKENSLKTGTKH